MIIIGLFNVFYIVVYQFWNNVLGVDFIIFVKVLQVWDYIMNLFFNGKVILFLFLDLFYLYFLIIVVVNFWFVMLIFELIVWIFCLIKL